MIDRSKQWYIFLIRKARAAAGAMLRLRRCESNRRLTDVEMMSWQWLVITYACRACPWPSLDYTPPLAVGGRICVREFQLWIMRSTLLLPKLLCICVCIVWVQPLSCDTLWAHGRHQEILQGSKILAIFFPFCTKRGKPSILANFGLLRQIKGS